LAEKIPRIREGCDGECMSDFECTQSGGTADPAGTCDNFQDVCCDTGGEDTEDQGCDGECMSNFECTNSDGTADPAGTCDGFGDVCCDIGGEDTRIRAATASA